MKKRTVAVMTSAAMLALTACTGQDPADSDGDDRYVDGATFTMAISGDPGALNPATAVQGNTNLLLSLAYDTLVYIGPDGELVPGLAKSWDVAPNSVTFTLNEATCADGSAVTPTTVARSINHVADPETKSPLVGVLIPADVSAEGDDAAGTVTLSTENPSQFLLHSTVAIFIICGKGLDDPSILDKETSGSGPFQLSEAVADDHYTLTKRDGYTWGPEGSTTADKGVPETVVLRVISEESTAANLLLNGTINAGQFSGSDRARLENAPNIITTTLPGGNGEFFFNQHDGRPGADPAVRKALTQALNLDDLAKISTQNTGLPSTGMTTLSPRPCRVDSVTGHRPTYDVEAAKAGLDAAGWTAGADGIREKDGQRLSTVLLYNTDFGAGTQAEAEYQQDAWRQIGVDAQLRGVASAAWSEALFTTGDWDVSTVPIGVSLPSQLTGYLSGPATPDGSNFANIRNERYVQLTNEAAGMAVADGACEVWAEAESALFDNFDVVPVAETTQLLASNKAEVFMPGGLAQGTKIKMLKG